MTPVTGDCTGLAFTGLGYSILAIVFVAVACIAVGIVVVGRSKQRGRLRAPIALLLVLGVCVVIGMAGASSARAAASGCNSSIPTPTTPPTPGSVLSITQTSTIAGLAPGVAAATIAGTSTNNGDDSVFLRRVVVRISSVTKAPHAAAGSCDASDYVVLNPQMPVDQSVPPQGSVQFTGATIGFNDRSTNQDACKGATVRLIYELYES
jgi:hypothetical protein